jgi:disulfide bond formation protein DsbB
MEQTTQHNVTEPSYWASIGIAAVIFSLLTTVLQLISGYMQINAEPTGSLFSPTMLFGVVVCLIGAFGGMVAVWHYANEYQITMKLGKGALIGFLTGVGIVLIGIVLNKLWLLVDPDMQQKMMESTIANFEAMDMPEETKQQMIDQAASQANPSIGMQLLYGIPIFGILNLLTGMLGVSLFARNKEG